MTDDNQHDGPKRHTKPTQKGTEPQKGAPAEKSPGGGSGGPLIAEGGVPDWPPVEPAQIDPEIRSASAQMIDAHVGARLLALRQMREISQHQLGEALGLTFQQVQKYERGLNRISAGRLYIAATFQVRAGRQTIEEIGDRHGPGSLAERRPAGRGACYIVGRHTGYNRRSTASGSAGCLCPDRGSGATAGAGCGRAEHRRRLRRCHARRRGRGAPFPLAPPPRPATQEAGLSGRYRRGRRRHPGGLIRGGLRSTMRRSTPYHSSPKGPAG